jgi:hypothetical protein
MAFDYCLSAYPYLFLCLRPVLQRVDMIVLDSHVTRLILNSAGQATEPIINE